MRSKWDEMLKAYVAFMKKKGHGNVSACDPDNRSLGQWVSSQRYKRKIGALSKAKIAQLDGLGFVWSAADKVWQSMFEELVAYARKHKTTNIPERCAGKQKLSNWVHNQRHRRKIGRLAPERVRKLDEIGFCWSIRRKDDGEDPPDRSLYSEDETQPIADSAPEERLYLIRGGLYVQYGGSGRKPKELMQFLKAHGGEYPAYIPLPRGKVTFTIGNDFLGGRQIEWSGKGPLPEEVMKYVAENGTLPRYDVSDD